MAIDNYIPKVGEANRIDNSPGKTMRGAIGGLLEDSGVVRIASGYFRLSGVVELEEDLRRFFARSEKNKIQLLISNQYDNKNTDTRKLLGIAEKMSKYSTESFKLDNKFYQEVVQWISSDRLEVKIFVDSKFYETHSKNDIAFLHGKAYLFSHNFKDRRGDVLIGSSNFTYGGLVENRELNIFSQDSFPPIKDWFDEMWENYSEKYSEELLAQFEEQKEQYSTPKITYTPIEYFYWNLGKYFGEKAPESLISRIKEIEGGLPYPRHNDGNKYFVHQLKGIQHVYTRLNEFDTQILADGVGLGKTLEAATIIKLYLQDLQLASDKRKVLILANDRLREQWIAELNNVKADLSFIDITTRQKFTVLNDENLEIYAATYALVVIDEAHEGFLRKNNRAYQNMQKLVKLSRQSQGRTLRGLLLTATPWNNSREDVIRLGLLLLNIQKVPQERQYYSYLINDREKLLYDVKDSGNYNQKAYIEFWKDLFHQRTRTSLANESFLSDRYPKRDFPLENGDEPFTMTYSPKVSAALNEILERLIDLKLPYQDTVWQYFGPNAESNVIMRQRFQLLRRADSSNAAFGKSLENIKSKLEYFEKDILKLKTENLSFIKKFFYEKVNSDYAEEYSSNEEGFDFSSEFNQMDLGLNKAQKDRINYIDEKLSEKTLDSYLDQMLSDTENDINSLDEILEQWYIVSKNDEKQKVIVTQIKEILSAGDKVLIFSEFSDTVDNYFRAMLDEPEIVSAGIGMVRGGASRINFDDRSKEEVLGCFSPQSKSYELVEEEEISVLIGTDAISTGQNLQDANHIITIELPYNPMRLEQRIGRIDRPKLSGENRISVYAFPSEEVISAELKLSERFENKAKGATTDTEGDFKLPFVNKGQYKGIMWEDTASESRILEEEYGLIAFVSETEARERVFDFYQNYGEFCEDEQVFAYFPYSFGNSEQSLLLYTAELQDINQHSIMVTAPNLWDLTNNKALSFVEVEHLVRSLLQKDLSVDEQKAQQLIERTTSKYANVIGDLVECHNHNLKSVSKLEIQPAFISKLREVLLRGAKKDYRDNILSQRVDAKRLKKIIDSLSNRGFSKEQNDFLKLLRDKDGDISSKHVYENIWTNLSRFITLFDGEMIDQYNQSESRLNSKANKDFSKINVIASVIGNTKL
ncbi:helicase-related protein [Streptococcus orisratti]|uniref:helicase-related protein n=1 Tax=Streptococcus orisratti TaxID=114652 RepID=UPI00036898E9|nr:helicase-related protein [Streptococcus orisratti]